MTDYTELMRRAKESTGISDVSVAPDVLIGLFTDLDEARNGMKYSCAIRLKKEIERLESEAVYSAAGFDAAREEIARLKAEVAGLRTGYEAYEQVNAELKAEVELLESSRAKLAGELSRLRAKHKDWSVIAAMGKGEQS